MDFIQYDMYDIGTRHPAGEFCDKMNKNDEWVVMCFNTDFVYYTDDIMNIGRKYQCLINPPNAPVVHGPLPKSKDGFENDWIIFCGDIVYELVQRLDLPLNQSFDVTSTNCLTPFLTQIREEENSPMFYSEEHISNIITSMLISIARQRREAELSEKNAYHTLRKLRREMLENYTVKTTLAQLSEKSGYSVSRFCELYKKFYTTSPIDDLINMRISKAKQLLTFSGLSVGEIAERCGFESIHYFSNAFKKIVKCSPGQYRKLK